MVQISQVSAYLFIYYFIFYYFILILHNSSTHTLCTNSKLFISLLNLHSILFFFFIRLDVCSYWLTHTSHIFHCWRNRATGKWRHMRREREMQSKTVNSLM